MKTGTILARSVEDSVSALKIRALKTQIPDRQVFAHFVGGGGWNVLDRGAQALAGKLALEIVSLPQTASLEQGSKRLARA